MTNKNEITTKDIIDFATDADLLVKFLSFLKEYIIAIASTENEIENFVDSLVLKSKQEFKKEEFLKDLWIIRYTNIYLWFFDLKPAKNQAELDDNLLVIKHALRIAFETLNKTDYIPWLMEGFTKLTGIEKINISNLEYFNTNVPDKIVQYILTIPHNCTLGRFGGELHDGVLELIMSTIKKDRKSFALEDNRNLTDEDLKEIKEFISNLRLMRQDYTKDFFSELLGEEIK